MTDHGDEGDDDPQLGGLRAMWLSMPDEDPPQRGLADLMAAARVKADEMARPSLWQRIIALLKRPPVLALATVMVLIAGVVVVGNRRAKFDSVSPSAGQSRPAEMTAGPRAEPEMAPVTTPTMPAQGSGYNTSTANEATLEPPPPPPPPAKAAMPAAKAPVRRESVQHTATSKGKPAADDMLFKDVEGATEEPAKKSDELRETKAEPKTKPKSAVKTGEKLEIAMPEPDAPREVPEVPVSGAASIQAGDTPTGAPSTGSTKGAPAQGAAQLHAQARTAASHNDCATVKVMVQRIAKQDPAYYRANVTRDAAIAKCTGTTALH